MRQERWLVATCPIPERAAGAASPMMLRPPARRSPRRPRLDVRCVRIAVLERSSPASHGEGLSAVPRSRRRLHCHRTAPNRTLRDSPAPSRWREHRRLHGRWRWPKHFGLAHPDRHSHRRRACPYPPRRPNDLHRRMPVTTAPPFPTAEAAAHLPGRLHSPTSPAQLGRPLFAR